MLTLLKKQRWLLLASLAILIALLMHVTAAPGQVTPLTGLDHALYDLRLRTTMPGGVDPRIVILDIDEKTLQHEGRWPWSRDKLARLMDLLFDRYHVKAVGFDVVFAEPDNSSPLPALRSLANGSMKDNAAFRSQVDTLAPQLDYDARFAASLKGRPIVLGYYLSIDKRLHVGQLPSPVLDTAAIPPSELLTARRSEGYGANLPILQKAARSAGHFVPAVDEDGVTRRVTMLQRYGNAYYEPLSLALYRVVAGMPPVAAVVPQQAGNYREVEFLQVGPTQIPVDDSLSALVPFHGGPGSFRYLPITDVLQQQLPASALEGKIAIVGTTAPGLMDLRVAPVASVYPGVEIHANLLAGMLDNAIPARPTYLIGGEALLLIVLTLVLLPLLWRSSPFWQTAICAIALLLLVAGDLALWRYQHLDLRVGASLVLVVLLFTLHMTWGYFFEARRKRQLTGLFGQYVPPELVQKMSEDPEKYTMDGQSRELTVLFSDVRGFTSLSESMDPKQLTTLMNEFLTGLSEVIRQKHLGTIDKYIGDCVMAFWGAPVWDPDHAVRAVGAALDMHVAMAALAPKLAERGLPPLNIGVGVNSGRMTVGDMGSQYRMAYTVMGDSVNTASRLEALTRRYGVGVIVGELTRDDSRDAFLYRELDKVRPKGKSLPLTIFEPICRSQDATPELKQRVQLFHQALRYYRERNWDMAEIQLLNLQKQDPETELYQVYLDRIAAFRQEPPPDDWDGVYTLESK